MKETVLLTGGAGFIGSHIAVELLQRDYDVVIADDLSNSRPDVPERIEKITGRAPVFYRMDVSDRQALDRVFRAHDIAAAVHLAGYKAVGESVQKPLAYYRNNLDTTLALLEVMADHGVHRLIFSSSATVYGNAEAPCREDMSTGGCTNPYAWTKLMIEQILRDAAKADPSLAAVCLRYFNPVGAHESGLIGELPNGIPNNLMPYITQTAAGIRRELTVFGNDYPTPDGTGVRDYIHVVDLARGHAAALDYSRSHPGWEAINLGTGRGSSVLEIVETFQRVNGVAVPHRIGPAAPGTCPPAMPPRTRPPACCTGTRKRTWRICAGIPGAGSRASSDPTCSRAGIGAACTGPQRFRKRRILLCPFVPGPLLRPCIS